MCIGIIALLTGKTAAIITLSVFGALCLYIISMVSVIRLRKKEPHLERPFRVPFYPFTPLLALVIAILSLIAMIVYNLLLAGIFLSIMLGCFITFLLSRSTKRNIA